MLLTLFLMNSSSFSIWTVTRGGAAYVGDEALRGRGQLVQVAELPHEGQQLGVVGVEAGEAEAVEAKVFAEAPVDRHAGPPLLVVLHELGEADEGRLALLRLVDGEGVHLVAQDVEVVLLGEVEEGAELLGGVHGAYGVRGVGEDHQLGDASLLRGAGVGLLQKGLCEDKARDRGRRERRTPWGECPRSRVWLEFSARSRGRRQSSREPQLSVTTWRGGILRTASPGSQSAEPRRSKAALDPHVQRRESGVTVARRE